MLYFQRGAEDPGQVADLLRRQIIVLHEALDAARAGVVLVTEQPAHLGLPVEGQPVVAAPRQIVEPAADGRQKPLRLFEAGGLARAQHPVIDQIRDLAHGVEILGDPEQRVQVPQAALAVLDVGLQDVTRSAHPAVALVAFGELGLDEGAFGPLHHLLAELVSQLVEQPLLSPDVTGLEDRGADRQVFPRKPDAVLDRPGRVTDLEAEIPQHVEDVLDHLLVARGALEGQHEKEIDIGMRGELAAAVTADGGYAKMLAGGRVGRSIHAVGGEVVNRADRLVDQEGLLPERSRAAARRGLEPAADFRPPVLQRAPEDRESVAPPRAGRRVVPEQRVQLGVEGSPVDDRPLPQNPCHGRTIARSGAGGIFPMPRRFAQSIDRMR